MKDLASPDDLVRPEQHGLRNRQADLLRGLEIDHKLKLLRLLDGQVGWLSPLEVLSIATRQI